MPQEFSGPSAPCLVEHLAGLAIYTHQPRVLSCGSRPPAIGGQQAAYGLLCVRMGSFMARDADGPQISNNTWRSLRAAPKLPSR